MPAPYHSIADLTKVAYYFAEVLGISPSEVKQAIVEAHYCDDWADIERSWYTNVRNHPDHDMSCQGIDHPAVGIIHALCPYLPISEGEALYHLGVSRLITNHIWDIDEHWTARAQLWQHEGVFGYGHARPGTVVHVRLSDSVTHPGYLCANPDPEGAEIVLLSHGLGHFADSEVSTPLGRLPKFLPSRLWLPYGKWKLRDGSEVVFSRDYCPLWKIGKIEVGRIPPWLKVTDIVSESFFRTSPDEDWASGKAYEQAVAYLNQHRVAGLPILVEILPLLIKDGRRTIREAVDLLRFELEDPDVLSRELDEEEASLLQAA